MKSNFYRRKAVQFLAMGMVALALGLLPASITHATHYLVRGFLIGLSIVFDVAAMVALRRFIHYNHWGQ